MTLNTVANVTAPRCTQHSGARSAQLVIGKII